MRSNETFTYREAMYAMLTRNANEAAMGLAYAQMCIRDRIRRFFQFAILKINFR